MKKIISVFVALLISLSIFFNCIKASAVALPASVLTYLIEACYTILVGSGTVSQSDFNNMNTSEVFDTTNSLLPSFDLESDAKLKADFIKDFNQFLNDAISKQLDFLTGDGLSSYVDSDSFYDFINGHVDDLATVPNFDMNGYGCVAIQYDTKNKYILNAFYGSEGQFYNLSSSSVTFTLPYSIGYTYFSSGAVASTSENSSVSSTYDFSGSRWVLYGNWVMKDGSAVPDGIVNSDSSPASIGTVDVDGTTYDVTGDGTVTIGDTTYTINDDGTVTINGDTYYPTYDVTPYDDTALLDLLNDILNQIQVVDDTSDDVFDDVLEDVEAPAIGIDSLDSMILPKTISTVFPFCLPFDFVRGMKLFAAKPEVPHFEVKINVPAFLNVPAQTWEVVIDLEKFEPLAIISRWLSFISFSFVLISLSATIVKGAH